MTEPNKKPDNPTLFWDIVDGNGNHVYLTNVTLRDLFATAVVAGLSADSEYEPNDYLKSIAELSYEVADVMLTERNKVRSEDD